jgi:Zn-dependent protease
MSDLLVLVPENGDPVALPRSAWEATVDFLAEREAFHETLLEAWRQAPGVTVSDLQATRMAGLAEHEAEEPGTDDADRDGLERLAEFCRDSGGFLVAGPEALANSAAPVEPAGATAVPEAPAEPAEPAAPPAWHGRARRLLGPFAILLIFSFKWLAKLKILLVALPKIGFLKTALLGLTNVWFYALFWGWRIAVLVVVLLLVHEAGHAIAYRGFGLGVARIGFVPFIGAYAMSKRAAENAWITAMCALAGPFIGGLGCIAFWVYGHTQGSDLASAAAALGFLLNLFNLVPVVPFDGGAAAAAIHPYVWLVGVAALASLAFVFPNIILWLFLAIAAWQAYAMLKRYRSGDEETLRYYRSVTTSQRVIVVVLYFGLAALLAVGMFEAMPPRPDR